MNAKASKHVHDMVYIALGAVLITVCSWISIPTEIPFTLQTMAVVFVCALLGGGRGCVSVVIYILLGAVGVPVFAGMTGGFAKLIGMTGGYIIGFIFTALVMWLFQNCLEKTACCGRRFRWCWGSRSATCSARSGFISSMSTTPERSA